MLDEESPTPALKKIDVTIARLRLLLADVNARAAAAAGQRQTFRDQRDKLLTFALYGDSTLESVLAMLRDVDERVAAADALVASLADVRRVAERELESLQLTKGIEEARLLLARLRAGQAAEALEGLEPALSAEQVQAEIARLQALINAASERAARSVGAHN